MGIRKGDIAVGSRAVLRSPAAWDTASIIDNRQSETGIHHEQPAGTDWPSAGILEKGYPGQDWGRWNVPAPGSYFPMAETSGTTVNDVTGNGFDGTYVNSPTLAATSGPFGKNVPEFNGTDNYIDFTGPDVNTNNAFTISAWIYSSSTSDSGYDAIFTCAEGGTWGIIRWWLDDDNEQFVVEVGSGGDRPQYNTGSGSVPLGQWHLATLVFEANTEYKLYLNDSSVGDFTNQDLGPQDETTYRIGAEQDGGAPWDRYMGHFMMWQTALTATDVSELYNATL